MFLDRFHSIDDGLVWITPSQASRFAKEIAGDFNPIHDTDARRFCVPGDLLFALVLSRFGLSQRMSFCFRALLGKDVGLQFRTPSADRIEVTDSAGKVYLEVDRSGELIQDPAVIEDFTRCYVSASGKNFPHTLQPLMEANGVMFNPERPMVMYESMSLTLDSLDIVSPALELDSAELQDHGKRGQVFLSYHLEADGEVKGQVTKSLVLSGLRPYNADAMANVLDHFYRLKARGVDAV
ncbi:DUF3581 domain-containing protein [Marinobacter salinisoli]|uniref:DUF3581 domain-containing protein n=1 Tax=Marinobacter salinisoli TaxID=2769486 RepID=A0ABX7MSY6_9GAMM|nr:DUF3581 family protein [Marinobacter salinisoli]QSP95472.1 DUF3581 domain-containing protein [Marinobacter salinisoli]